MNRRTFVQALALIPAALGIKAAARTPLQIPGEPMEWLWSDPIRGLWPHLDGNHLAYADHRMFLLAKSFGRSFKDPADMVIWVNQYDRAENPCKEFGYFENRDTGRRTKRYALGDIRYREQFAQVYAEISKDLFT